MKIYAGSYFINESTGCVHDDERNFINSPAAEREKRKKKTLLREIRFVTKSCGLISQDSSSHVCHLSSVSLIIKARKPTDCPHPPPFHPPMPQQITNKSQYILFIFFLLCEMMRHKINTQFCFLFFSFFFFGRDSISADN